MSTASEIREQILAGLPDCVVRERLGVSAELRRLWPPRNLDVVLPRLQKLLKRVEASQALTAARAAKLPEVTYPEALPIATRREEIISLIRAHPVVVIAGETGSGKTTQIPKICLDAGLGRTGKIGCTQPRRVAALSVAKRVAEELKVEMGAAVGCQIRFTDQTSDQTLIKFMTDGILLNEIQMDPMLSDYDAIIVDEAHERSLNIDFILGYLKSLRARRPDLKIIITSATIDTEAFSRAFDDAPIVEVSGRVYPVDVVYAPIDEMEEASGNFTYIDGIVRALDETFAEYATGDVLVFLPGERDIREAREVIEKSGFSRCEVLPLFGRLSNADQQRIFAQSKFRKIILATNIAETSITVPGIRFVIDVGLARVSRYSPHTRTQRLPIEKVSQSSANQRKGRCGRVAEGVCIRLYSEQDFLGRDEYSTPEILRSNLASVILRMMAFRLGSVEEFPFIDPPDPRAVRAGYQLLLDLGALDETHRLTELGKQLARLPVDPTVGRMLLQAHRENALKSVLVIAAGMSIQDPRERPLEKQEAADRMHQRFIHPESDFLTLLNLWNAYHGECESLSQKQLRKFCKSHFVSYLRMREWREIHQQLVRVMKDLKLFRENASEEHYDSVHRSILCGLLGNIAQRDQGNHYRGTHGRHAMLFPGSGLFDQKIQKQQQKQQAKKRSGQPSDANLKTTTPRWIVCGEWVETNRLYARSAARIDVSWVIELGKHLFKKSYSEPAWSAKASRVLVRERAYLYGLEIENKRVGYGRINSEEATEIFIREALVEGDVREQFIFLEKNLKLRAHLESLQTRLRNFSNYSLDERAYQFYADKLKNVSSAPELRKWLNQQGGHQQEELCMAERDLLGSGTVDCDEKAFPGTIEIDGQAVPLDYSYKPGEESDGVTLRIGLEQVESIDTGVLDWLVPGYIEERVSQLLRALPKGVRKQLFPIAEKTQEILLSLKPSPEPLTVCLGRIIAEKYGIQLRPDVWQEGVVPDHLLPRIEIVDAKKGAVAQGRNWGKVQAEFRKKVKDQLQSGKRVSQLDMWRVARERWEKPDVRTWSFGDLPERIVVGSVSEVTIYAYPGLKLEEGAVSVTLFKDEDEARQHTPAAYRHLCEQVLGKDLVWFKKDLKDLSAVGTLAVTLCSLDDLKEHAYSSACLHFFAGEGIWPLTEASFQKRIAAANTGFKGLSLKMRDWIKGILEQRQSLLTAQSHYAGMQRDVARLVPADFVKRTPMVQLAHLLRYLRAIQLRNERARQFPQKDAAKGQRVAPYVAQLGTVLKDSNLIRTKREAVIRLFWLLEEFRVAVYAPELGTAEKVSEKRLDELIREIQQV